MLNKSACPYCGEETCNVPNHIRMSKDAVHGPQGVYPDDFEQGESGGDGLSGDLQRGTR